MVKKKDNLKEFNEEEQVIEMGPVKKEDKSSKINFVSIFLSSLSLILVITLFVFFNIRIMVCLRKIFLKKNKA